MSLPGPSVLARWGRDTAAFSRECLKYEPDRWQLAVYKAFDEGKKIRHAMQACAGPGKTRVLATIGWKILLTKGKKGDHPNGYAISISGDNLKDNLWKELALLRQGNAILEEAFEWTAEKIFSREFPATWWLKARSYSKSADPTTQGNALSGLHAKTIFYLVDEGGEINPAVLKKAEQGLSNCEQGWILLAGNPTSTTGALHEAVDRQAALWHVTRITGDPDDPNRSPRISLQWATEQITLYGRDNPWVMSYILGQFPPGGLNTLLSSDEVRDAMTRVLKPREYTWSQKRLGIDVARFGADRTVIWPRQGLMNWAPVVMRQQDTNKIGARVLVAITNWGSEREYIDDTGHWGHGVVDNLIAAGRPAQGIIVSDPATEPHYYNRRTEMAFRFAMAIKRGAALPNIPDMVDEFTALQYGYSLGKILLESKEQVKTRILKSTDMFDAGALTYADPDSPGLGNLPTDLAEMLAQGVGLDHLQQQPRDYDPFDPKRMEV